MSDNWQVGDLAVCVETEKGGEHHIGKISKVERVFPGRNGAGLVLESFYSNTPHKGWIATASRKIIPDNEPCEAEFTALIKRGCGVGV